MGTGLKWAFSTLGCPKLGVNEVAELAAESNFRGIELRAADDSPIHASMGAAARREAAGEFRDRDLTVVSIASYVQVGSQHFQDADVIADLERHADLADDLGATYLRVFAGSADTPPDEATKRAEARLLEYLEGSATRTCIPAIETHDGHSRVRDVVAVPTVENGSVAVVWDSAHSVAAGEPLADSARLFGKHPGYAQLKDFRSWRTRTPTALGGGVMPLDSVLQELSRLDDDCWVSWEHEAYWHADARPLDRNMLVEGRRRLEVASRV